MPVQVRLLHNEKPALNGAGFVRVVGSGASGAGARAGTPASPHRSDTSSRLRQSNPSLFPSLHRLQHRIADRGGRGEQQPHEAAIRAGVDFQAIYELCHGLRLLLWLQRLQQRAGGGGVGAEAGEAAETAHWRAPHPAQSLAYELPSRRLCRPRVLLSLGVCDPLSLPPPRGGLVAALLKSEAYALIDVAVKRHPEVASALLLLTGADPTPRRCGFIE
jgi:hypothetical protein